LGNVKLNCAPGAIVLEFQTLELDVAVCATTSVFVHVTEPPTAIIVGFGRNASVPSTEAPLGIATGVAPLGAGVGVGVGVGLVGGFELYDDDPQPAATIKTNVIGTSE